MIKSSFTHDTVVFGADPHIDCRAFSRTIQWKDPDAVELIMCYPMRDFLRGCWSDYFFAISICYICLRNEYQMIIAHVSNAIPSAVFFSIRAKTSYCVVELGSICAYIIQYTNVNVNPNMTYSMFWYATYYVILLLKT